MTRGFITVATGKEEYYNCALNLLRSFKLYNPDSKFAIICDRENEYTKEFDDVVIIENPSFNYLDKFRMLTDCPFDENIFIETDCLVYHNLDNFWNLLSREYDFTSFGWNDAGLETWFDDVDYAAEKFLDGKNEIPLLNPGYMFIRKGEAALRLYEDAMFLIVSILSDEKLAGGNGYKPDKHLFVNGNLRDDPVFALAMKRNGLKCTEKPKIGKCIALPSVKSINKISLLNGVLDVITNREYTACNILHFSSRRVKEDGLYSHQIFILNMIRAKRSRFIIKLLENNFIIKLFRIAKKISCRINH